MKKGIGIVAMILLQLVATAQTSQKVNMGIVSPYVKHDKASSRDLLRLVADSITNVIKLEKTELKTAENKLDSLEKNTVDSLKSSKAYLEKHKTGLDELNKAKVNARPKQKTIQSAKGEIKFSYYPQSQKDEIELLNLLITAYKDSIDSIQSLINEKKTNASNKPLKAKIVIDAEEERKELDKKIKEIETKIGQANMRINAVYASVPYFISGINGFREASVLREARWDAITEGELNTFDRFNLDGLFSQHGSIYSELANTYFNKTAFRCSFGIVLANVSDSVKVEQDSTIANNPDIKKLDNEALQRFLAGGGNAILNLSVPFLFGKSVASYGYLNGYLRGAMDVPTLGNSEKNLTGNVATGLESYFEVGTKDRVLRAYVYANWHRTWGSKTFFSNLGMEPKGFFFGQMRTGIIVSDLIRIYINIPFVATDGTADKLLTEPTVGIQFQPSGFKPKK